MEIMIMGYGVVGQAMAAMLSDKGDIPIPWDPPKGMTAIDPAEVGLSFVCVSAPTNADGTVDISAIEECVSRTRHGSTVVIRSTVPPGTTDYLNEVYEGRNIFFVPEFLSEATAAHDAKFPSRVLIGVPDRSPSSSALSVVKDLMRPPYMNPDACIFTMSAKSAEFAKYVANSFYALKVAFFNEAYDVCERSGANWNEVLESVRADRWTGEQHTDVWHGGYRGYGGKCLPKDVRAFRHHAQKTGFPMLTLEAAEVVNMELLQRPKGRPGR